MRTVSTILFAMAVGWVIWYLCMKQLALLLVEIDALNEKEFKIPRLWVTISVYSIAVIYFNRVFKKVARNIVIAENRKYRKDHEDSLVQKSYTLGFFNSYLGMGWAAFVDRLLVNVCGLLLSVLMLKQIIMNTITLVSPKCSKPKIFRAHKARILEHYSKYPEDYAGADPVADKHEHYEAER